MSNEYPFMFKYLRYDYTTMITHIYIVPRPNRSNSLAQREARVARHRAQAGLLH
jgi:hypothetical protein